MTPPALPRSRPLALRDGLLLAEALATLAWASAMIAILPFRRVAALSGARVAQDRKRPDDAEIDRIAWAVRGWARRVPWRTVCFQQGLAVHLMLRRRGVASLLHYGVASDGGPVGEARRLGAHVWVGVDGRTVVGGEEAPRFACLATFGDEAGGDEAGGGEAGGGGAA